MPSAAKAKSNRRYCIAKKDSNAHVYRLQRDEAEKGTSAHSL